MKVEIFTARVGNRLRAFTKEMLDTYEADAMQEDKDGKQTPVKTLLDTPEKLAHVFPGGKWNWFTFEEDVTGQHKERAESLMYRSGKYEPQRYGKGWAVVLVNDWEWDASIFKPEIRAGFGEGVERVTRAVLPVVESSFNLLPDNVVDLIELSINQWKDSTFIPLPIPLTLPYAH